MFKLKTVEYLAGACVILVLNCYKINDSSYNILFIFTAVHFWYPPWLSFDDLVHSMQVEVFNGEHKPRVDFVREVQNTKLPLGFEPRTLEYKGVTLTKHDTKEPIYFH